MIYFKNQFNKLILHLKRPTSFLEKRIESLNKKIRERNFSLEKLSPKTHHQFVNSILTTKIGVHIVKRILVLVIENTRNIHDHSFETNNSKNSSKFL